MQPICTLLAAATLLGCAGAARADDLFDASVYRALTSDRRAHRTGDTLTVLVLETSSASANADSASHKQTDFGVKVSTPNRPQNVALGLSSDFSGKGSTVRSGRLLAQLTVSVTRVDPNGDLHVAGEQLLEINKDRQQIKLEGRVRPADIGEGNTVASNRLADARISYVGDGVLGDSQQRGWLHRILGYLGLM